MPCAATAPSTPGVGTTTASSATAPPPTSSPRYGSGGLTGVTTIAPGYLTGYALRSNGTLYAWGANPHGELGDGTTTDKSTPVRVRCLNRVTTIAASLYSGYAVRSNGIVYAWGWNYDGELGDGSTTTHRLIPVRVRGLTGVTAIAAGFYNGYAVRSNGTVYAWGSNADGALGDGTTAGDSSIRVQTNRLVTGIAAAAGESPGYALHGQ